jgi:1-deoxy-D-xylulose-5-phosphate reductoisomerase
MMNKGLEFIEAMRLYRLPADQVSVVVHRQSIVHSLVEYVDGAVMAQLGVPDMRIPIQLALTYPDRVPSPAAPLDLLTCGPLTFEAPDPVAFPCLRLAMDAARRGGTACAILNGANEAAVDLFLKEMIGFADIWRLVSHALQTVPVAERPDLETILNADRAARQAVAACYGG